MGNISETELHSSIEDPESELKQLKDKYDDLSVKKTRAETILEESKNSLDQLKKELRRDYQTDDLEELQRILKNKIEENQTKIDNYREHIEKIEQELNKIENSCEEKTILNAEGLYEDDYDE